MYREQLSVITSAFDDPGVLAQDSVHRGDRPDVHAPLQQGGVHIGGRGVDELGVIQHGQDTGPAPRAH
jgi:hypothetical protein